MPSVYISSIIITLESVPKKIKQLGKRFSLNETTFGGIRNNDSPNKWNIFLTNINRTYYIYATHVFYKQGETFKVAVF